jgi:hypothetical protein
MKQDESITLNLNPTISSQVSFTYTLIARRDGLHDYRGGDGPICPVLKQNTVILLTTVACPACLYRSVVSLEFLEVLRILTFFFGHEHTHTHTHTILYAHPRLLCVCSLYVKMSQGCKQQPEKLFVM